MIYIIIALVIIIGILGYKLLQKQKIDRNILQFYEKSVKEAENSLKDLQSATNAEVMRLEKHKQWADAAKEKLDECKKELQLTQIAYNDLVENRMKALDEVIEEQRLKRQQDLDNEIQNRTELVEKIKADTQNEINNVYEQCANEITQAVKEAEEEKEMLRIEIKDWESRWLSILNSVKRIEQSKQEKLFYTIQLPEEYQADIEFLLTTVAAKVQHPDIISKLVWAEYVKPNLDDTFKRIELKPEPGIYKLTSLQTGKCYIGKSTNVKNRIADHFKSSIGIKSIADQAVHHAILKEGFWNWLIEIVTYCDKDKLNELEKYYIEFFKAQEFGYNKTGGG